ncbi:hypothetical protein [uncultured Rubinisphaera sp.]|uniref:hypothetical protein n=1 Tax=uncultured Rubinisphaera sp. TaxID=1678686 RepID=UPI0030D6E1C8
MPITRKQFRKTCSEYRYRAGWSISLIIIWCIVVFGCIVFINVEMCKNGIQEGSFWRALLFLSGIPAFWGGCWVSTLFLPQSKFKCTHCNVGLELSGMKPFYIMATGRCQNCTEPIFVAEKKPDDVLAHSNLEGKLHSRTEIRARSKLAFKSALQRLWKWPLIGFALTILGASTGKLLAVSLLPQIGEMWTPFVAPLLTFPGIILFFSSILVLARRSETSKPCPHCGSPVSGNGFAALTGYCDECGKPAICDPHPGLEPSHNDLSIDKWSTKEFYAIAKSRHERNWIGCLIGFGFALIWLVPFFWLLDWQRAGQPLTLYEFSLIVTIHVGMLMFQLAGMFLWELRSFHDHRCPACKSNLMHFSGLVISSKRCCYCGTKIIAP